MIKTPFMNQKETDRAIKAAVDQAKTFLKKRNENTHSTGDRRNHHVSRRPKR
jgi:hypothetical protein